MKFTVSRSTESIAWGIGALLIFTLSANRSDDGRIGQVLVVDFGRIGIVATGADVVDVEIGFVGQGPFDTSVADVVGVDAIGVGAGAAAGLQGWKALVVQDIEISLAGRGVDYVSIIVFVEEINVGLFLHDGIEKAVVDPESN